MDLPIIVVQPRDQLDIVEGANVTFTVNVSGLMISYQWQKDGVTISDSPGSYSGTMTNELTVFNVTDSEDEGFYSVVVSNPAGSVTSNQANLTLLGKNAHYTPFSSFQNNHLLNIFLDTNVW